MVWVKKTYDAHAQQVLMESLNIPELLAGMLVQRGISDPVAAEYFLNADLTRLADPFALAGMAAAVERIEQAIQRGEKIVVFGDYDVDGIASTVILLECLRWLKADVDYYVPNRFFDGYGVQREALEELQAAGTTLIVTVDCGISVLEEALYCQELGMDLIITDHHTPGERLPQACAIVNPKLDPQPETEGLCGAGVAYKLALALAQARKQTLSPKVKDDWLGLAAMATVADIVPLTYENRILAKYGLSCLQKSRRPGVQFLLQDGGFDTKPLDSGGVSFQIAPKLNSAGRLATARVSVETLLCRDKVAARDLVDQLSAYNIQRKELDSAIFQAAVEQVTQQPELLSAGLLIVDGAGWNQGVIGIVASRLVEKYHRSVVIISWEQDEGRASCRGTGDINIHDLLQHCSACLKRYGGHKKAGGFDLRRDSFAAFSAAAREFAARELAGSQEHQITFDAELSWAGNDQEIWKELQQLLPFGEANPEPVFLLRRVKVVSSRWVGQNAEHLSCWLQPGERRAIAFRFRERLEMEEGGNKHDVLLTMTDDHYRGAAALKYQVVAMQEAVNQRSEFSGMGRVLTEAAARLAARETVVLLAPDYRSLQKLQPLFAAYFPEAALFSLHGQQQLQQRALSAHNLRSGRPALYLMTRAGLWAYLRHYELPPNLGAALLIGLTASPLLEHAGLEILAVALPGLSVEGLSEETFTRAPAEEMNRQPLVYLNRRATLKTWQLRHTQFFSEIDEPDIHIRRRQRLKANGRGMFTDGVYLEEGSAYPFTSLILADMPYTRLELAALPLGLEAPVWYTALAPDAEQINRTFLRQMYPEAETIGTVQQGLWNCGQKVFSMQSASEILRLFPDDGRVSELEFLASLHIFEDLGLCEYKKQGNIVSIQLNDFTSPTLQLTDSVYYQEGRAAKNELQLVSKYLFKNIR
jgi:single-stranded-DNA-specific exonuclease